MRAELAAMADEERALRDAFKAEHGEHLPDDLCLAVENAPTRWDVAPAPWPALLGLADGAAREPAEVETVPEVDADLLADAREKVAGGDGGLLASLASI
jgi:autophagy-related protein 17